MMRNRLHRQFAAFLAFLMLAVSCSTTRVLSEGEYRLAKNSIEVTNSKKFDSGGLNQYIKQQPNSTLFGWNPFIYIYNWVSPDNESGWARFCRTIGTAPVVYSPGAVESTIDNIESHLEYIGYYNSKVSSDIRVKGRKVAVNYLVHLGKQYLIDSLSYSLPSRGTFPGDFMEDLPNVSVKVGDILSEASLEDETVRGTAHFRDLGYYTFSKNNYVFEADTISVPGRLFLDMKVNDYSRNENGDNALPLSKFLIDSVTISHSRDLKFNDRVLRELNTIRPGAMYSESDVRTTYTRLSALRLFSSVGIEMTQTDTNLVNCAINLSQSRLQGFKANLEASTNSSGLMGVSPQLSFYHKNIFHGGEWLNLSFMGNFQFMLYEPVRSNEFGVSAGLSFPRFLGLPYSFFKGPNIPRTEINLSYNFQDRPEYVRHIMSTSFGYSGIFRRVNYQLYPLQLNLVQLSHMVEAFDETLARNPFMRYAYQNHLDAGVGGIFYYSSSTKAIPDETYWYTRLTADLSGNVIGLFKSMMKTDADGRGLLFGVPYSQYVRSELTFGRTWRFGKGGAQAIATRLLAGAGYSYGNSSVLPFEKQFYVGGANSMRGWQARSLGPGTAPMNSSFILPSQTGDMKLEANVEYRFPLTWKLEGAFFVDAGNVWTFENDDPTYVFDLKTLGDSIAMDWGIGLRINLNFIVLRLDAAKRLHDPAAEQKWLSPMDWPKNASGAIHFGVGYPF
ncbi:MAG: BamA/TamA family outer membrane protein [Bacteroidales bacterium]|nr:BamA/TamA family outer membrane protein [Bacteroidales bacterium]